MSRVIARCPPRNSLVGHGNASDHQKSKRDTGPSKEGARISRTTLREFSAGDRVEVVEYGRCDPADVVLARARSLLGKGSYDLFASNCEHFARWCKTGEAASEQVRRALAVATTVGGGSAALAGGLGTVAAGGLAGLSGPGIMSGLASIGGTAVGGVVVLATAPVALTTAAMHNALRDDVALPARERAARSAGRSASIAAGVAGTVGSVGLISSVGVSGLSAAGITSGLAGIGAAIGGGMAAGVVLTAAAPAVAAAAIGDAAYRFFRL